jgi:HK97 gp10 family phage protein
LAAKNRVVLRSNFPAVKRAKTEFVRHAVDAALIVGENTANQRIERNDARKDYNLPADVDKERIGFQSGKISYDHWWGRFFEYGTVYIPAVPFMRPAHRAMRQTFIGLMGSEFDGWVKRRAGVRR